nr:MAG TPA: hypothetical protein [Caudoviricetes sp.]
MNNLSPGNVRGFLFYKGKHRKIPPSTPLKK